MPTLPLIGSSPARVSPSASKRTKVDHKLESQFAKLREEEKAVQRGSKGSMDMRGSNGHRTKDVAYQDNVELRHAEFELQVIAANVEALEEKCATEEEIQKEKRRYVMAVRTVRCLRESSDPTSTQQATGTGNLPAGSQRASLASRATAGLAGLRSTFTMAGGAKAAADEAGDRSPRTSEASTSFRSSTRSDTDHDVPRRERRNGRQKSLNMATDLESKLNQMTEPMETLPRVATGPTGASSVAVEATCKEGEFNPLTDNPMRRERRGSFLLFLAQATQEHRQPGRTHGKAPPRRGSLMRLLGSSEGGAMARPAPQRASGRRGSFLQTMRGLAVS
jgi:hypothetical protein